MSRVRYDGEDVGVTGGGARRGDPAERGGRVPARRQERVVPGEASGTVHRIVLFFSAHVVEVSARDSNAAEVGDEDVVSA